MQRALIMGGSDGIGLEVTRQLLRAGWQVQGISRSAAPVDDQHYQHLILDVTSDEYLGSLRALLDRHVPDVCIWCVGIGELFAIDRMELDVKTMQVNLVAAVATASIVAPAMVARGAGRILFLSSQADVLVSAQSPAYNASKAGLSSYVEGLALALRPLGVEVTNVRFGFVDTKMAKSAVRPFMISPTEAAAVVLRSLDHPSFRLTRPYAMAVVMWLLAFLTEWKLRLG
jgi:NAD(P)-dependent dehydrogenase (short-subunit alcohol dehydrogenase family)